MALTNKPVTACLVVILIGGAIPFLGGCGKGLPKGVNFQGQTDGSADDGDTTTVPNPPKYPPGLRATDGDTFAFSGAPKFNELSAGAYGIPGAHTNSKIDARSNNKGISKFSVTGLLASVFPKVLTYTIQTPVTVFCTGGGGEVSGQARLADSKTGRYVDGFSYSYKFGPNSVNPTTECDVLRVISGRSSTATIPNGGIYLGRETGHFKGLPAGDYEFVFEMNVVSVPDGKTTLSAMSTIDVE